MALPGDLLQGLRVLTFESFGAGPYGSMYLADLGAEVIKIENPHTGGDPSRGMGPTYLGENDSVYFQTFNMNKRSLTLDLKTDQGREVLHRLVKTADATMDNLRGDLAQALGIHYEALRSINPKIVCAHISAFGRDNPRAKRPGYDFLMQAEAGFFSMTGEPGSPPARFGLSMVDFMTGTTCALGLVSALLNVQRGGGGCDVDISLYELALHQTSYPASWYLNGGIVTERLPRSSHPSTAPNQLYRTEDGWIFVMCMKDKFWEAFLRIVGETSLADDPRFATMAARVDNRDALTVALDEILQAKTTDEWVQMLKDALPVAPVYTLPEALDNPFAEEIGMVRSVPHAERDDMRMLANPLRVNGRRPSSQPCASLGSDTDALLAEVGYGDEQIAELRQAGVV